MTTTATWGAWGTEAATQVLAFIGKRGSGKTYAAGVLVEDFLDHDIQVVVIDLFGRERR